MLPKSRFRVLVIDDEKENIQSFKLAFRDHWEVDGLTDPGELKKDFAAVTKYDLVFLDLLFDTAAGTADDVIVKKAENNELLGLDFLDWVVKHHPNQAIAIYSGYLLDPIAKKLRTKYPHIAFVPKPVDLKPMCFRTNMEWYAQGFVQFRFKTLFPGLGGDPSGSP